MLARNSAQEKVEFETTGHEYMGSSEVPLRMVSCFGAASVFAVAFFGLLFLAMVFFAGFVAFLATGMI